MSQPTDPMLGGHVSSIFQRENLRSVREFFGLDSGLGGWGIPSLENGKNNVSYFQLNYILIAAVILAINFMIGTKFMSWIGLGVLGVVWFFFVRATNASSGTISVLGKLLFFLDLLMQGLC